MKSFACKDIGMNCQWSTTGNTDEEILAKAGEHGRHDHGMKEVGQDIIGKVKKAIRNVKSA